MTLKLIKELIPSDNTMPPNEGFSHWKTLMTIEPFLYIPQGFYGKSRTFQAAFRIKILDDVRDFVDDEIFNDYSPAGKKAQELVADFLVKFDVLNQLVVLPNIESVGEQ